LFLFFAVHVLKSKKAEPTPESRRVRTTLKAKATRRVLT